MGSATKQVVSFSATKTPQGRYVYCWFNSDSPFPFYVGKGVADRAWRRHLIAGRSAACQSMRAMSSGFFVHIVKDNLTNEGAMLLEASLIDLFARLGACQANQVSPLRRQEVPPLWLSDVVRGFRDSLSERDESSETEEDFALESQQQADDYLISEIVRVLDEHEGRGGVCLNVSQIQDRVRGTFTRDAIYKCMRQNGLNP